MAGWLQRKMSDQVAKNISNAYWGEVKRLRPFAVAWATGQTLPLDQPVPASAPFGAYDNFTPDGVPATQDGVLRMHRLAWKVAKEEVRALQQMPMQTAHGIEQAHLQALAMRAGLLHQQDHDDDEEVRDRIRVGRRLEQEDPHLYKIAREALSDWLQRFPEVANAAGRSDDGATTPARMLVEAFAAAGAAKAAIDAGDGDPHALFDEQVAIAKDQADQGVTGAWVVAFCQIRCIAVGYVMGVHARPKDAEKFRDLAQEFFAKA